MIRLNLAYEEALKQALPVNKVYTNRLSRDEALILTRRMLERKQAEAALRELMRSDVHDAEWYGLQGQVFMLLEQYDAAEKAYRQAVRMDPENNEYHAGALEAIVALRNERTLRGKLGKLLRNAFRNGK